MASFSMNSVILLGVVLACSAVALCLGQPQSPANIEAASQISTARSRQAPGRGLWPRIKELRRNVHFDGKSPRFQVNICSEAGTALYVLDARMPPSDDPGGSAYDYSGAFDCRLYPAAGGAEYPTLLQNIRNATRDWQTDGRFLREELVALSGAGESRCLVQRSRVRGMLVEIEIYNVTKDEGTGSIRSFDARFSFSNDPMATSDTAAPDHSLTPNRLRAGAGME